MARLYANENFPLPVVQALRQAGHDVITVAETGKAERSWPDEEVLEFATQDNRAVLTLNRKHFLRLHRERPDHAGIILCTFDRQFVDQAA
jgi:predicted nuclease of predicted toxin-antitoxin system